MNRINFMYIRKKEPQIIQNETPTEKEPQQIYKNHKHTLSEIIELRKSNPNSNIFKADGLNTIETNDKTPEKLTKSKKLISSNTSGNFKYLYDYKYNSKSNLNTVEEDSNNNIISDKSRKRSFLLKDFSSNDIFSGRIKKISKYLKQEKKNTIIEENEIKQKKKENENTNDQYYKFKQIYRNIESQRLKNENTNDYLLTQQDQHSSFLFSPEDKNLVIEAKKKYFEKKKNKMKKKKKKKK